MFDIWKNVLTEIEEIVDKPNFVTFLKDAKLVEITDGVAKISVPDVFKLTQVKRRFSDVILETIKKYNTDVKKIELIVANNKKEKKSGEPTERVARAMKVENIVAGKEFSTQFKKKFEPNLNPKYTMENFVMGSNNDLAVSVAKYVIEHPGEKYNPFFLYGGPGLGKTHLVQAVGNALLAKNPQMKVLYIPVDHFYSEFVSMIRNGKGEEFANKYRQLDTLIIDDFQFIMGKDRSQEEFFNIFNDLHLANKQIIITSDRLPSQIKTLDERLSSRLSMAGAIDLQMPNFEDRCAILKCKAEFLGAEIEDEAIEFIAEEVKTNIRDLEREFTTIMAMSDLKGVSPLTIIQDGYVSRAKSSGSRGANASSKKILERTAKYYDLTVEEMCSKSRVSNIKNARQVAMFFLSKELKMSTKKIALEVGVKDHTTVMHGVKKIENDIKTNFSLREQVEEIKEKIYE